MSVSRNIAESVNRRYLRQESKADPKNSNEGVEKIVWATWPGKGEERERRTETNDLLEALRLPFIPIPLLLTR
jgi:hypothetical protein